MDDNQVKKILLYLENQGWSDLIDYRWKSEVINEIHSKFPNLEDDVLNKVLNLVLY